MKHRGELLNQVLTDLGIRKGYLANKLGVHRNTITNLVQSHDIPDQRLLEIGEIINYDFSDDLPELSKKYLMQEPAVFYKNAVPQTIEEYKEELLAIQRKYILLQEKYMELLAKSFPES